MLSILVVEDDKNLNKLFRAVLERSGYNALGAEDGEEALYLFETNHVDLIICDVMMPVMDGFRLTKKIRATGLSIPILMITARESFEDKERGFLAGIDDYMVKPVDVKEMVLRVGALLRRAKMVSGKRAEIGGTILNYETLEVSWPGGELFLPQMEFNLLYRLVSFPGQIFTRQQLMDEIWGVDSASDERTVDVHVSRLRERLVDCPDLQIITVRGLGYKIGKIEPK